MTAANVDLRCSTILFRKDTVLLVHRGYDGLNDWVLPGGTPRAGGAWWPVRAGKCARKPA